MPTRWTDIVTTIPSAASVTITSITANGYHTTPVAPARSSFSWNPRLRTRRWTAGLRVQTNTPLPARSPLDERDAEVLQHPERITLNSGNEASFTGPGRQTRPFLLSLSTASAGGQAARAATQRSLGACCRSCRHKSARALTIICGLPRPSSLLPPGFGGFELLEHRAGTRQRVLCGRLAAARSWAACAVAVASGNRPASA